MRIRSAFGVIPGLLLVLLIAGCGGGGGGSSAPPAPTGAAAVAGDEEVTVSWDNVTGATSYNIYYSTTPGVTIANGSKLAGRTSPSIVTGLTNGTTYYFVVTTVSAGGESAVSTEVSAAPVQSPPPGAPTNVSASSGVHQVTVSWDAVAGATSYNIYYSTTTGVTKTTGTKISGLTASPEIVTGLTNGTTYYFVVTAQNDDGESVESTQVSAAPSLLPALSAPSGVGASAAAGGATLTWSAVSGAASYNAYYSTTTGVTKATGTKVSGATSGGTIPNLIRGVTYYFVVTTVNADGVEGSESSQVSAAPSAPSPTFAQSDLAGTWNVRVFLAGVTPGWYGYVATIDSAGAVTASGANGTRALPTLGNLTMASGAVTETGNASFHGQMSTTKNLIVATSTMPEDATYAVHFYVKRVAGLTYAIDDTTMNFHRIYSGTDDSNATGSITAAAMSVNSSTGIVSITAEPTFSGMMTSDRKIIIGTSTDGAGLYSLRVIQVRGQTYSLADLVGVYTAFSLTSSPTPAWAYGPWDTNAAGEVTADPIYDSTGATTSGSWTMTLTAGGVTGGDGLLSYGKDLLVETGDVGLGSYMEIKVQ